MDRRDAVNLDSKEWRSSNLGTGRNQRFSLGHGTFEMPAKQPRKRKTLSVFAK